MIQNTASPADRIDRLKKEAGRYIRYSGSSMIPTFRNPEILIFEPYRDRHPRRGDVIAFQIPGTDRLIVHRIMALREDLHLTRGDNNNEWDEPVRSDQIKGKIVAVLRNGKELAVRNGWTGTIWGYWRHFRSRLSKHPLWQRIWRVNHRQGGGTKDV